MSGPLPASVEFWAKATPDAPAAIEGDRVLTWGALDDQANRLAHGLAARGVAAGDIVVVRTQIRLEWTVIGAALGKLGCSLLALNWRLTPAETQYVLANSGASVVICDDPDPRALLPAFDGLPIKLAVSIDIAAPGFASYAELLDGPGEARFAQGTPPLIIYTSGTTGLPKGVVMSGRSDARADDRVAEYLADVAETRRRGKGDVALLTLPLHHGAGPATVWGSYQLGNCVIFMRRFDPEGALKLIERHKVTSWTGVPTMYKRMAALPAETLAKYDVSSIRALSVGAAPVSYSLKTWIMAYFGPGRLGEGYGATEVGMISFLPPDMHTVKPGSSGRLHRHVDIQIRNEAGNNLPAGQEGEIWVRTPTTIRQYLNGKPLGPDTLDADGFFRVGDVGKIDDDGYIFITDRAKDMIISGGVNIYPAEIEAELHKMPGVADCAVFGIPDTEFGEALAAHVQPHGGAPLEREAVRKFLKERIADYKVPRVVEFSDALPREESGKIFKRRLRDPYWQDAGRRI
jgi:long-chain acyl-CoA synthetase